MNDAEYIAAIAEFYKDGPSPEFRAHYERLMHISAAIAAAPAQAEAPAHAARAAQAEPEDLSVAYFMGLHAENETLHVENEQLRAGYDAARLEIASLQAQLEAVGAGGVGPLMAAAEQPAAPEDSAVFDFWRADHMPQSDKSEAWAEWCALRSTRLAPQQAAQAQDDAVAQAVADEREETKELRVALDFLAGLHPHLTIDGPPMAVAERIFDAVMGEQAELKARLASYERNMESLRAHLAKHTRQGTNNAG